MLDEKQLRTPGFSEGYKVKLADGQEWTFPKPKISFRPKFVGDTIEVDGGASYGPEHAGAIDILTGAVDAEPGELMQVRFALAIKLLRANYRLENADLVTLLEMEIGDQDSDDRWASIRRVLVGVPPKELTSDGSDSPAE